MSGNRISKYVAAVSSGYANVAANIAFTFLSLRLASDHLNPESFGVWMVAADAANFFSLFELGISNGLIQQFVQHGKEKAGEGYRLAIGSAWLLFGILSCMLLIGVGFTALILPRILGLPPGLVGEFQSVLAALGFGWFIVLLTKPFSLALLADHRMATLNLGAVLSFATNLVVTTLLLRSGFGIMALVAGNLSGVAASSLSIIVHCIRLSLMPAVDRWMRPSWPDLVEPLRYGLQVLMINLGMNLVFFSRTMAVSRALDLPPPR